MVSIPLELGGGGGAAAANNELSDGLVKNHGLWKTDKVKDIYCRDDIEYQLLVTLSVGI